MKVLKGDPIKATFLGTWYLPTTVVGGEKTWNRGKERIAHGRKRGQDGVNWKGRKGSQGAIVSQGDAGRGPKQWMRWIWVVEGRSMGCTRPEQHT
jgi:hypothetical protein